MTHPAADPSLAVSVALSALRQADAIPWTSDLAATFRLRVDAVERLVVGVSYRVDCAGAALARLAVAA
ncbi:MAG TPA: hypothetical protein VF362_00250 [Demequinaceae bacterium]